VAWEYLKRQAVKQFEKTFLFLFFSFGVFFFVFFLFEFVSKRLFNKPNSLLDVCPLIARATDKS